MKYKILTFGCQMNEHDSEVLAGLLEERGYGPAERPEDADVVVFNTCCVRDSAETRVMGHIGEAKRWKAARPGMVVAVAGCMPQQAGRADEIRSKASHVDIVLGTHNLGRFPELLDQCLETRGHVVEIVPAGQAGTSLPEVAPRRRKDDLKAWVTISLGCGNFCAYCIVPYVRGPEKSRPPAAILEEVRGLARQGCKEITLLGQNVNTYGRDLPDGEAAALAVDGEAPPGRPDFAALLGALDRTEGIARIRYMTSHPRDFSDRTIEAIARSAKVCEHFHLPVQAGSDRILQRMNRGYTRENYFRLVEKIREMVPDSAITTDIIVGFPGETEEDFLDTMDLVRRVGYDGAFTLMYSPRRGTPAARFPDQVPLEVKKERIARLIDLQKEMGLAANQKWAGRTVDVMVDGPSEDDPHKFIGRTRTNKMVVFPVDGAGGQDSRDGAGGGIGEPAGRAPALRRGDFVDIIITKAHILSLEGRLP